MAIELAPKGVLVNAIAPGSTLSEGTRKLFYGPDGKFVDRIQPHSGPHSAGRPAEAEEIAHGALSWPPESRVHHRDGPYHRWRVDRRRIRGTSESTNEACSGRRLCRPSIRGEFHGRRPCRPPVS